MCRWMNPWANEPIAVTNNRLTEPPAFVQGFGELVPHPGGEFGGFRGGGSGLGRKKVLLLQRIRFQVVEFRIIRGVVDELVGAGSERAIGAQGDEHVVAVGGRFAAQDRSEGACVDLVLRRKTGELAERGIKVDPLGQRVATATDGDARSGHNQRHPDGRFVGHLFLIQAEIPKHFAVVGSKNDDGPFEFAAVLEGSDEAADLSVDVFDLGGILAACLADVRDVVRAKTVPRPVGFAPKVGRDGVRDGGAAIFTSVFRRRVERVVRPVETDLKEPRKIGWRIFEEVDRGITDGSFHMERFR